MHLDAVMDDMLYWYGIDDFRGVCRQYDNDIEVVASWGLLLHVSLFRNRYR